MHRPSQPTLVNDLRVLERGGGEVQLGSYHPSARVLTGLSAADREVLRRLDGTRSTSDLARLYLARAEDPARLDELLLLLREEGLVDEGRPRGLWEAGGPALGAPEHLPVLVAGVGDLTGEVARVLGRQHRAVRIQADHSPGELPAPSAERSAAERAPALVVLVVDGALDPVVARQWAPWAMVLPVVVTDDVVTVGPLWADLDDPCPVCLDHYRTDRDPAWPRLLVQLAGPLPDGMPRPASTDAATTALACGAVAAHAVDAAGPRRLPPGLATEVQRGAPLLRQRVWPLHPRCLTHLPAQEPLAG